MQASKNTFKKTNQLIVKLEQFLGTVVKEQDDSPPSLSYSRIPVKEEAPPVRSPTLSASLPVLKEQSLPAPI